MTLPTGSPQVGAGTIPAGTIRHGSIVLIGNCKAAAVFQVTEDDPVASGALSHDVGGALVPGNASASLQQTFRGDAAVWQLQTHHYFVAPSVARAGTRSLWRYAFPPSAGKAEPDLTEVSAGIERMVVTYGISAPPDDRNLNRYVSAENVPDWNLVVAVRVQLLAATTKDGVSRGLQTVSFAGSAVTATDHRLRSAMTEVVTLRNRAQ
jgi:type IV pilus assembly protein PilW